MIFYYGIRPTAPHLHLGHAVSLFNMFKEIKDNLEEVTKIYILLAGTHAEISSVPNDEILTNGEQLSVEIIALLRTYLREHGINPRDVCKKVWFINQSGAVGTYHANLTYKYLPLVTVPSLLKNPIFKNSDDNSMGFLLYPILQAFDIILYADKDEPLTVFVSNDQRANINVVKDVCSRLKLDYDIRFNVNENVLHDHTGKNKMSKSLGNYIELHDEKGITNYIDKYVTYPRPKKTTPGNHLECPMHNDIATMLNEYLGTNIFHVKSCDTGLIGCRECKVRIIKQFINVIWSYKSSLEVFIPLQQVYTTDVQNNFLDIYNKIDKIRSKQ